MSDGVYSQNFDALGSTSKPWTNNLTLPAWCASKGSADSTNYVAGTGTSSTGALYSFGANGVNTSADRALGSVASAGNNFAYGVRFTNNTAFAQTNITVSFTGEQWRNGGNTSPHTIAFSCRTSNSPITNSFSGTFSIFATLNFTTPILGTPASALDGNAPPNRQIFTNIVLIGIVVQPGQELFVRWFDVDDAGFDHGLAIDDLTVAFNTSIAPGPPSITAQPQSQTAIRGSNATFTITAAGALPLRYQWQFNGADLSGATNSTLILTNITFDLSGSYSVAITNSAGSTNSAPAFLNVALAGFSLLTYNTHGNGIADWSTNTAQVQAIGRQLMYLQPDIITFNEIPHTNIWQMTNWVKAFLPGYFLATNSGSDNFINSVIASRFPITRSQSWLDGAQLEPFGFTNSNFTRDLFEAQIAVPNFPQPLHVFVAHLKATTTDPTNDALKRGAEAAAITNFFATNFLVLYPTHPYLLAGDLNEDIFRPATSEYVSAQPIQRLTNSTGLQLTTPVNPVTGNDFTESIQGNLNVRFDYILPNALLFSNIADSQVFRTDLLNPLPPNLLSNDDVTGSDHLPVQMIFGNPYDKPFRLTFVALTNQTLTLKWESVLGQPYRAEVSSNLFDWSVLVTNLVATNYNFTFTTNNVSGDMKFFRIHREP